MANYQAPNYPAPLTGAPVSGSGYLVPQAGEFAAGTGYYDGSTNDPESRTASYISTITINVATTSSANDPYNQTVGFIGFGECAINTRGIPGDVLRRNCRGTIAHDINYFNLLDNVLPSIATQNSTYPEVNGSIQWPPYAGLVSDNNHWMLNTASALTTTAVTNAAGAVMPPLEPNAEIGAVLANGLLPAGVFDDINPPSSAGTGTYRPKNGGGIGLFPKGNSKTGGLLLPCAINPVTGVLTALPGPAATYVVGAQPVAI